MSRFPTLIITIIVASCAVFSCAPPIGTIKRGSAVAGNLDEFWTVPRRQYYIHGDDFVRKNDLWAFASYNGLVETIPIEKVEISLVKNPRAAPAAWDTINIKNGAYTLVSSVGTGQKLIRVTYENMTAEYSIEVRNPDGTRDPEDNNGNGSSVIIKWSPVVKFNSNNGTKVSSQIANPDGKVAEPPPPNKPGFTFGGWYEDAALTKPFDFNKPIDKDIVLFAKWI